MNNMYKIAGIIESVDKYYRVDQSGKRIPRMNVVIRTNNKKFNRHTIDADIPVHFEFSITHGHIGYEQLESSVRGMSIVVLVSEITSRTVNGKTYYNPAVKGIDVWFATDDDPTIWISVDYSLITEKKQILPCHKYIE